MSGLETLPTSHRKGMEGGRKGGKFVFVRFFFGKIRFLQIFSEKIGTFSYLLGEDKEILEEAPAMGTT